MIKSNLSTLMGQHRMKIIDVARAIGVHRNSIDLLYKDEAKRIDIETLDKLCTLFKCTPNDILSYTPPTEEESGNTEN